MSEELAASSKYIIRAFNGKQLGLTLIQPDIVPPPPRPVIKLRPGIRPEVVGVLSCSASISEADKQSLPAVRSQEGRRECLPNRLYRRGRVFAFPEVAPQKWVVVVFRPN